MEKALNDLAEFPNPFACITGTAVSYNPLSFTQFAKQILAFGRFAEKHWPRFDSSIKMRYEMFAIQVLSEDSLRGESALSIASIGLMGIFKLKPFALPAYMISTSVANKILQMTRDDEIAGAICNYAAEDNALFASALKQDISKLDLTAAVSTSPERVRHRSA